MRKVVKKLQSVRGASLLVSMLLFLLCLTIGSLIVTTAFAGALKAQNRYSEQQSYLASASAARLLKNIFGGYTYSSGYTWQEWETGQLNADGSPKTESGWVEITPFITPDDAAGGDLLTDTWARLQIDGGDHHSSFDIDADHDIPIARCEFSMTGSGDARFLLICESYTITVAFTARTAHVTDYISYDYYITSWSDAVISKGVA